MSRVVMAMAVDQIPVRRGLIQCFEKLFKRARLDEDMGVLRQDGMEILGRNRQKWSRPESLFSLYFSNRSDGQKQNGATPENPHERAITPLRRQRPARNSCGDRRPPAGHPSTFQIRSRGPHEGADRCGARLGW